MAVAADEAVLRQLIDDWVLWRDCGDWDRFAQLWHPEGRMVATWFEGPARRFIEAGRVAREKGVMAHHIMGGTSIIVNRDRAIGNSRMTLHLRADIGGEPCDIACLGRFHDRFQKLDGRWGLLHRQTVYEKDRLDPVRPDAVVTLDRTILERFPAGYRHLAYAQTLAGLDVNPRLPGTGGASAEAVAREAEAWLLQDGARGHHSRGQIIEA